MYYPGRISRQERIEEANAWTERQAARLGISPEAILKAVEHGWLAPEIESIGHARELLGPPPSY